MTHRALLLLFYNIQFKSLRLSSKDHNLGRETDQAMRARYSMWWLATLVLVRIEKSLLSRRIALPSHLSRAMLVGPNRISNIFPVPAPFSECGLKSLFSPLICYVAITLRRFAYSATRTPRHGSSR